MAKRNNHIFILIFSAVVLFWGAGVSKAESQIATGSTAATANLIFWIHIPETLYLQIGRIDAKQDIVKLDADYLDPTNAVLQNKKGITIKASGIVFKRGTVFLSSGPFFPADPESKSYQQLTEFIWNASGAHYASKNRGVQRQKSNSIAGNRAGNHHFSYSGSSNIKRILPNETILYTLSSP